jgi:hypothetical protein
MGFLSKFKTVVRVDLGDGYWADVRQYLTRAQMSEAQKRLAQLSVSMQKQDVSADMDINAYQGELAAQAVVSWNLTDENDQPLPHAPIEALRKSLGLVPDFVVEQIVTPIKLQPETDAATFQGAGAEGAGNGEGRPI